MDETFQKLSINFSQNFTNAWQQDSRRMFGKVTVGDRIFMSDELMSINLEQGSIAGEAFAIGSAYANSANFVLQGLHPTLSEMDEVVVELGIMYNETVRVYAMGQPTMLRTLPNGGASVREIGIEERFRILEERNGWRYIQLVRNPEQELLEEFDHEEGWLPTIGMAFFDTRPKEIVGWAQMGVFYISERVEVNRNTGQTTVECLDGMIFLEGDYEDTAENTTIQRLIDRVTSQANVSMTTPTQLAPLLTQTVPTPYNFSHRQVLGQIAQLIGAYVTFNREGVMEFRTLHGANFLITPDHYIASGFDRNDIRFQLRGLTNRIYGEEGEVEELSVGSRNGSQLHLSNNMINQLRLDSLWTTLQTINYYPFSLTWRGNPTVDSGRWLTVIDLDGEHFNTPALKHRITFNGGLRYETSADTTPTSAEVAGVGRNSTRNREMDWIMDNAIPNARGNNNFHQPHPPSNPREGDLWFRQNGNQMSIYEFRNGEWVLLVSDLTGEEIREYVAGVLADLEDALQQAMDMGANFQDIMDEHTRNMEDWEQGRLQHEEDMANHEDFMQQHTQAMADHEARMSDHQDAMDYFYSEMGTHRQAMNTHQQNMATLEALMQGLEHELANHQTDMANHTNDMANHTNDMADHSNDMADHSTAMGVLRGDMANHGERISQINNAIDTHNTAMANLQASMADHSTRMEVVSSEMDTLATILEGNETLLADLADLQAILQGDLSGLAETQRIAGEAIATANTASTTANTAHTTASTALANSTQAVNNLNLLVGQSGVGQSFSQILATNDMLSMRVGNEDSNSLFQQTPTGTIIRSNRITLDGDTTVTGTFTTNMASILELNASRIVAGTINTARLNVQQIMADGATIISLNADRITAGTINTARLNVQQIMAQGATIIDLDASRIVSGSISADRISANTISSSHLTANSITARELALTDMTNLSLVNEIAGIANVPNTSTSGSPTLVTAHNTPWIEWGATGLSHNHLVIYTNTTPLSDNSSFLLEFDFEGVSGTRELHISCRNVNGGTVGNNYYTNHNVTSQVGATGIHRVSVNLNLNNIAISNEFQRFEMTIRTNSTISRQRVRRIRLTRRNNASLIVDGSITAQHIVAGSISANHIGANTISSNHISANAITATQLSANAVTATHISAGAITSAEISANAITALQLAVGAVNATHISANAITATHLSAGAVTANDITTGTLNASNVTITNLNASNITTGTLNVARLGVGSIDANRLVAGSITTDRMSVGTINGDRIMVGSLDANRIVADSITANLIQGGTITARELAISDTTNLATLRERAYDNNFSTGALQVASAGVQRLTTANQLWIQIGNATTTGSHWSRIFQTADRDAVRIGDEFRFSFFVRHLTASTGRRVRVNFRANYVDGTWENLASWVNMPVDMVNTGNANGTQFEGTVVITSQPDNHATRPLINIACIIEWNTSQTGGYQLRQIRLMRRLNGQLIVDGTIQAHHIVSNTITTGHIVASGISANVLTSGTINANTVNVTNINAGNITSGFIGTQRMEISNFGNYIHLNQNNAVDMGWRVEGTGSAERHFYRSSFASAFPVGRDNTIGRTFRVQGGEQFRVTMQIQTSLRGFATSALTGNLVASQVVIRAFTRRRGQANTDNWGSVSGAPTIQAPNATGGNTGWLNYSAVVTVVDDAEDVTFNIGTNTWGNHVGALQIRRMRAERMSGSALIVHGGITTDHMAITGNLDIRNYRLDGTAIGTVGDHDIIFRRGGNGTAQADRMVISRHNARIYLEGDGSTDDDGSTAPPVNRNRAGFFEFNGNRVIANNMTPRTPANNHGGFLRNLHLVPADRWLTGQPGNGTLGANRFGGSVRATYTTIFNGNQQIFAPMEARYYVMRGQTFNANATQLTGNVDRTIGVRPFTSNDNGTEQPVVIANNQGLTDTRDLWARRIRVIGSLPATGTYAQHSNVVHSELRTGGVGTMSDNHFNIRTNGSDRIIINANGNVSLANNLNFTLGNNGVIQAPVIRTSDANAIHMTGVSLRRWGSDVNRIAFNATSTIIRAGSTNRAFDRVHMDAEDTTIRGGGPSHWTEAHAGARLENGGEAVGVMDIGQLGGISADQIWANNLNRRRWRTNMCDSRYSTASTNGLRLLGATGNNTIVRMTSAQKYKLNINRGFPLEYAERVLDVQPATWYDSANTEEFSALYSDELGKRCGDPMLDEAYLENRLRDHEVTKIERVEGLVAEDVEKAGLELFVNYDFRTGQVEGLAYDRLWTLLIPLTKDHRDRVTELESKVDTLTERLEKLERMLTEK